MIYWNIVSCPLDYLLVAATPRGLCYASLGDSPEILENELKTRFSDLPLQRDDRGLQKYSHVLLNLLGDKGDLKCDVDASGTSFQHEVWQALRKIKRGETRTYSQVAQAIGKPQAVRAVARACATNPVALIVPCHRVLRTDGTLGGYRWGIERKRKLLERERS